MSETHLIVLWEYARADERRILDDISGRLDIIHTEVLSWPGDPVACFGRFYGANLADANGKVSTCGGGPFRLIVVRDNSPVYGLRETSRGLERVNLTLFDLKMRYREWTGGGHKVHTTNSTVEFKRDILLLTGRSAADWENGRPTGDLTVLPGINGWTSLRELLGFLDRLMPYVVLRNAESLPDRFDPALHGDIDLLVPDAAACASLLGARKVFQEPYRVHYEVTVGGRPTRFDFRYVGDGYYDTRWQRRMLERRSASDGVNLLAPEDAFFALVYHALYQKPEIAADYPGKARALAKAAGRGGTSFDDWIIDLEAFLDRNGYLKTRPDDISVFWNEKTVNWRKRAEEIATLSGATGIRPFRVEEVRALTPLRTFFFSGSYEGRPCFIKHSPHARSLTVAEWKYPQRLAVRGDLFCRPILWHATADGGTFVVTEMAAGEPLDILLKRHDSALTNQAETIVSDLLAIADVLKAAGIVHRDIRPANLLVAPDGHVRLIDFQFAAEAADTEEDPYWYQNLDVINGLGGDYALAPAKWNDRHSIRKCIATLPFSEARDRALAALATGCDIPVKVAALPYERMDWVRRRLARLRRQRLALLLFRRRRRSFDAKFRQEMKMLAYVSATWHVLPRH